MEEALHPHTKALIGIKTKEALLKAKRRCREVFKKLDPDLRLSPEGALALALSCLEPKAEAKPKQPEAP